MTDKGTPAVRVTLRAAVTRDRLAREQARVEGACGIVMNAAIREILAGAESTLVDRTAIKMATDNSEGVYALIDLFDLDDARTGRPLLWELLHESAPR